MLENSTAGSCCVDCHAEFPADYRTKRCESCRSKQRYTRDNARRTERNDARWAAGEQVECTRCHEMFPRAKRGGQKPKYCPPCRVVVTRETARRNAKPYVSRLPGSPEVLACRECAQSFEYVRTTGKAPKRCRDCAYRRTRDLTNAARRNARREAPSASNEPLRRTLSHPCEGCGSVINQIGTGRRRQICGACKASRKAEAAAALRRTSKPPIPCQDCGALIPIGWHGAGGQKRCKPCAKKVLAAAHKAAGHRRRARLRGNGSERFSDEEIFERDRWKCALCGKRIGKKLKHPHPRSASLDHIVPISQGGGHFRTNVQASHLVCNLRKHDVGGGQLLLIG